MALEKFIESLESEWEPETGFFWIIRQGEFRKDELDRAFAKFAAVRAASEELLPARFVSVLWYVRGGSGWRAREQSPSGELAGAPARKWARRQVDYFVSC